MWVIVRSDGNRLHTVGHYNPKGEFVSLRDFSLIDDAARYVHWLNGGHAEDCYEESKS
jgi:ribosomal protein S16